MEKNKHNKYYTNVVGKEEKKEEKKERKVKKKGGEIKTERKKSAVGRG